MNKTFELNCNNSVAFNAVLEYCEKEDMGYEVQNSKQFEVLFSNSKDLNTVKNYLGIHE